MRGAAWAGLQDSMPRAALLSIHARVEGTPPTVLDDPALVQVWGPRFSAYVVAAVDHPIFTLGRYPDDTRGRRVADALADRLHHFLDGRTMPYDDAGLALGVPPNRLRYATTTGRVLIRWEGARRPTIWTVPRPEISVTDARAELARRYVHVLGPTTPGSFAQWAGIGPAQGQATFEALADELIPAESPIGPGWMLAEDAQAMVSAAGAAAVSSVVRLLPSGDAYYLLQGTDRELLVPDQRLRSLLWTSRVWPGAVLAGGEIVGTWRRANTDVAIEAWRQLSRDEREAVEAEAESLPLSGLEGRIRANWVS